MSTPQWVKHISGQGKAWRVCGESEEYEWGVEIADRSDCHYLPKSEYVLCEPPEEWEVVTKFVFSEWDMRVRKDGLVYLIERKVST